MDRKRTFVIVLGVALSLLLGCGEQPTGEGPQFDKKPSSTNVRIYRMAVHPLYNPSKLIQAYQPLMDYINRSVKGVRFKVEASRDYSVFEEKYRARKPEFLIPNPWQTLQAMKAGYVVLAMAGDPRDFRGIFLVRRDSGIREPSDLKGRAVSYPAPTALAASVMPQYFLYRHGLDIHRDIENRYVGSQESSIMSVYLGHTAVGATWPPPWRAFQKDHPREAAALKIIWETESLVNLSVMARSDVPAEIKETVRKSLLGLHEKEEGKKILEGIEAARFFPASDGDYDVVRRYVARFEREVRPMEKR